MQSIAVSSVWRLLTSSSSAAEALVGLLNILKESAEDVIELLLIISAAAGNAIFVNVDGRNLLEGGGGLGVTPIGALSGLRRPAEVDP
jgi:hypothetical protein